MVGPAINQAESVPDVCSHTRSALPSPLKSPVATTRQAGSTTPGVIAGLAVAVIPFIAQTERCPSSCSQTMSAFPSLEKSAFLAVGVPVGGGGGGGGGGGAPGPPGVV